MLKKIFVAIIVLSIVLPNVQISYGASTPLQYAESDVEIIQAEERLNKITGQEKKQELEEMALFDERTILDKKRQKEVRLDKIEKTTRLQKIKGYRDLRSGKSVDETIKDLRAKGYPLDGISIDLYKDIETFSAVHPTIEPKEVVKFFNSEAGLIEKQGDRAGITFSLIQPVQAASISYSAWTKLTTSEKLLVVIDPASALKTLSIQKLAFNFTTQKFGSNGLGDKSDGYRHGIWNALMTRDISRVWAEAISTAHEDRPKAELNAKQADGFTGQQHKNMDLNNNKVGRSVIAWYEFSFNCSDETVKGRISSKLTNKSGGITWLHN